MTRPSRPHTTLPTLDPATAALVRLSATVTAGSEQAVRNALAECAAARVPERWLEELILQSYLFAGFPRTLNAAREWRRARSAAGAAAGVEAGAGAGAERSGSGSSAPAIDGVEESYAEVFDWRMRGEETRYFQKVWK